ncbi:MAG TPA: ATP-binding protein [Roseiflexaceae bacterium]|nr:ATP-binding protein [Roseiflexaceae bacterium]
MAQSNSNPFTERGRIIDPVRFAGRWSELSLVFERLESGRPVLVIGSPGIGKSSLLTHITQSAAVNLELPDLRSYYLDVRGAESAAEIYRTVTTALRHPGDTLAALELALVALDTPLLLCLDNAQGPLEAGWGVELLEALARVARGADLFLVVATEGTPPLLSEPFALLRLGALAQTEVRLLVESYLDGDSVSFTPAEIRQLVELSAAHPAYVQRAAYHLYQSKLNPEYDWRVAYLVEARERPVPGAPLPPGVFEGGRREQMAQSGYGDVSGERAPTIPGQLPLPDAWPILILLVPLILALLMYLLSRSPLLALAGALLGLVAAALWPRLRRQ